MGRIGEMIGRTLALLGIAVVIGFYAELLAHAPATGQDFRLFYAAASVLRHGGNPYDTGQLYREEVRLYHPTTAAQRQSLAGNPQIQGPPLIIALVPAVDRIWTEVYAVLAGTLVLATTAALTIFARMWPLERRTTRIALGAISPVAFLGIMLGQPDAVVLLSVALSVVLLRQDRAGAAGVLMSVGIIKPQIVAGPIAILALMAWQRRGLARYAAGVICGSLAVVGLCSLVGGINLPLKWLTALAGFGRSTVYSQVDVSSLATLYLGWAPHAFALAFTLALPLAWLAASLYTLRMYGDPQYERWWFALALTLWMLATPYAHPHDDVLLIPALWVALDSRSQTCRERLLTSCLLAAWWLLPQTSILGLRPPIVRGLGIVPVALLAVSLLRRWPGVTAPSQIQPLASGNDMRSAA